MKKKLVILCIILVFGLFAYKKYADRKIYDSLHVEFTNESIFEYGSDLKSLDLIVSYEGEIVDVNEMDTKELSNQLISVTVSKDKIKRIFEKEISIVDTQKPIIEFNKEVITLDYGKKYDFKENIKKVYDVIDGDLNYEIIENVNFEKVGSYTVEVKAFDSNENETISNYTIKILDKVSAVVPTYINGILLVNKTYGLPSNFGSGNDATAYAALVKLQEAAENEGYKLPLLSGYRAYSTQKDTFNYWCNLYGVEYAQNVSARPGHSEHQTGLAFDVASLKSSFGDTETGKWLASHCAEYGFILRYPKNKTHITGYYYEPWHIRYVGKEHSIPIMNQGITLEEYLGVKP